MKRLDSITALRFWAALGVLMAHGTLDLLPPGIVPRLVGHAGQLCVDFFFLLSGFVLTYSWKPERRALRFYWLRFSRAWPLHLVTMPIAIALHFPFTVSSILLSIPLLQSWSSNMETFWGLNGPSWTMSCEIFFYSIFPFMLRAFHKASNRVLVWIAGSALTVMSLIGVASLLLNLSREHTIWMTIIFPPARLPQFVLGSILAIALQRGFRPVGRIWQACVLIALVCGVAGMVNSKDRYMWVWDLLVTLPLLWLIATTASRELDTEVNTPRALVALGEWTFALYITHYLYVSKLGHMFKPTGGIRDWILLFAFCAVAIAISYVGHTFWEKPIEKWLRSKPIGLPKDSAPGSPPRRRRLFPDRSLQGGQVVQDLQSGASGVAGR